MIRVIFTGNFLWTIIFDLSLSNEAIVTYLWVGGPEMGGSERENPREDSRPASFPFLLLIYTNFSSNSIDFRFWFPIYNKKEPKSQQTNW